MRRRRPPNLDAPPPPTAAEAEARAEAIHLRHLAAGDTHLEYMPGTDDLAGVVQYVCIRHQYPGDIEDALLIVWHLRAEMDRRELSLLHAAKRHNVPLSQLAPAMGLRGRRGVDMRKIRLEAAAAGRLRIEGAEREFRRGAPVIRTAKGRWLNRHRDEIRESARAVLHVMGGRDWWSQDAADYAEELDILLGHVDASTGEMMAWLSALALDWQRAGMDAPVDDALRYALGLANDWQELG